MSNLGSDAISEGVNNLSAIIRLLLELERVHRERVRFAGHILRTAPQATLELFRSAAAIRSLSDNIRDNKLSAKTGQLNKNDLDRFLKKGENLEQVAIPKNKLGELEKMCKTLGGAFMILKNNTDKNSDTVSIAIPARHLQKVMQNLSIVVNGGIENGNDLKMDDAITKDLLINYPDTFRDYLSGLELPYQALSDNTIVIPKEQEEAYRCARDTFAELVREHNLDNIDMVIYDGEYENKDIKEVTKEEAEALQDGFSRLGKEITFAEEGDKLFCITDSDMAATRDKVIGEQQESTYSDDDIAVIATEISMNKESLLLDEDETSIFAKIPGSYHTNYETGEREPYCIKFDKAELEEIQGGQAYKINLNISDPTKEYQLYNANGEKANAVSVGELLGYYNKKGHFESQANDKTQKASHNKGEGAFRIELFDRNKNEIKLIGLPIKADELQNILKDKGLSEKDINNTVNRIYDRMPDYFRERFEYTPAKVELNIKKDVDIKTIKKTAELGEFLRSAEKINIGNDVRDKTKVIIVDKEHNKFMEASAKISRSSVSEFAKLFTKNEAAQAILSHIFSKSYDKIGLKENAEQVRSQEVQATDGTSVPIPAGSELPKEPMIVEAVLDDNKAFTIAVTDEDFAISSTVGDNIVYHTGNKDMDMETYSEMLMQDYGLTGKQTEQLLSKLDELNCGIFPETVISEKMSVKRFTKDSVQINVDGNKEIFRRKELNPDNISRRFELKKIYLNENAKDCKAVSKAAKSMLAENILKTFTFDKTFKSAKNMADRLNKGITGKSKEKIISNDERSR